MTFLVAHIKLEQRYKCITQMFESLCRAQRKLVGRYGECPVLYVGEQTQWSTNEDLAPFLQFVQILRNDSPSRILRCRRVDFDCKIKNA